MHIQRVPRVYLKFIISHNTHFRFGTDFTRFPLNESVQSGNPLPRLRITHSMDLLLSFNLDKPIFFFQVKKHKNFSTYFSAFQPLQPLVCIFGGLEDISFIINPITRAGRQTYLQINRHKGSF